MTISPPFNIDITTPGDSDFQRLFPANERTHRDTVDSWLKTEHDATTGRHKFPVDTTANLAAGTYPVGAFRYDTTKGVLEFQKSTGVWDALSVPSGTRAIFFQTNAPAGWTKLTDIDVPGIHDAMLAITEGSAGVAGTTAVSTVFASRTIAQANLPNVNFTVTGSASTEGTHFHGGATSVDPGHTHGVTAGNAVWTNGGGGSDTDLPGSGINFQLAGIATGGAHAHTISGDGAHTHTISGTAASGGSGTGLDFNAKKVYCILCEKD